ncbi:hypothetical protein Bca52824_093657 [Brassica carinata]|uniref:G-patch domain-containing protein n=1 Tax=Brassica carinata TaxID=52824 RepID=A0A8X7P3W6_BRACI|nr:hypothetical protein Bca52824_093657 [Brassica carinata]
MSSICSSSDGVKLRRKQVVERNISSSNVGFRLLQKMGWIGKGLGKQEQGITEPIKSGIRDRRLGLGKQEEDDYFTAEENIQRGSLILRSRRLRKSLRDGRFAKSSIVSLCSKQYRTVMEFEGHLSSYDHNHKKRFKEITEMHSASSRDDRKKREQQRQEREMTKMCSKHATEQAKEDSENVPASSPAKTTIAPLAVQEERKTLKLGFSSKSSSMSESQPTSSNKRSLKTWSAKTTKPLCPINLAVENNR